MAIDEVCGGPQGCQGRPLPGTTKCSWHTNCVVADCGKPRAPGECVCQEHFSEPEPVTIPAGITLDHFQELLDQAAIRRVRSFSLKTTMAGVAVELTAQFESPERKKDQHE